MVHCRGYEDERQRWIRKLTKNKIQYDLRTMLQEHAGSRCWQLMLEFIRVSGLMGRI